MNQERTIQVTLTINESQWDAVGKILRGGVEKYDKRGGAWDKFQAAHVGHCPEGSSAVELISWESTPNSSPVYCLAEGTFIPGHLATELGILRVTWTHGKIAYEYVDVPYAVYTMLRDTDGSVGRLVGQAIKGRYRCLNALCDEKDRGAPKREIYP